MQKSIIEFQFLSDLLDDEIYSTATAERLHIPPPPFFVHCYKLYIIYFIHQYFI